MVEWTLTYGPAIILAALGVAAARFIRVRRIKFANLSLAEDEREEMAVAILSELRASSPGPDRPISVGWRFWRSFGWPTDRLLKVLEYMMHRGWAEFPDFAWNTQVILQSALPTSVALTPTSYHEYTPAVPAPPSYVVYGPAHIGTGDQIVNGGFEYHWDEVEDRLLDLVRVIYMEASHQTPETATELERLADVLRNAVAEHEAKNSKVRSALRWLSGFTTDAASSAAGTGIAATASMMLGMIQR
ncbi:MULTISPECIES: hypothetical protein [Arthrobacter]|uniref:Uncharacterized protein n=2 Tax=Arthrobacter TaxID=1663 RepID=A0ABU9KFM1_9MICC|nr:hypothetical protein [Arthrobacter sp. YJM1]MDP5225597.1 hypothetical protein [Arthrobacter sp. YJM1]